MKRPYFFHHTLGYKKNPFGALTTQELTAVAFLPTSIQELIQTNFGHLQLLGGNGCGKTNTMLKIIERFLVDEKNLRYEYIAEGTTKLQTNLQGLDCFFLDEAQRLGWWQRRQWLKKANEIQMIFSSHRDLTAVFAQKKLPLHTINIETFITPDYYKQWLANRLTYFALEQSERVEFADTAVTYLYDTFGPNIRDAEYFLYDVWQSLTEPKLITAETLQ